MPPNVISASREELEARHTELLAGLGLTWDELRERHEAYSLSGDEWEAYTELEEIEFLLGD